MSSRRYGRKTISYPTINTPHRTSRFAQRLASGVTVTDLFCGGGGSTTGMKQSGADVVVAANHWQLAIDAHEANHPNTHHICADISAADPRNFPSTTGLWASPECIWHSPAGGRKRPAKQQALCAEWEPKESVQAARSRVTAWDICRFAEVHRYKFIIVENVTEFLASPLFEFWWHTLTEGLSYEGRRVSLNSMPTIHTIDGVGVELAPYLVPMEYGGHSGHEAYPVTDALHTQSTRQATGLLMAPLLMNSGGVWESNPRPIHQPYPTQSAKRQPGLLMAPYLVIERAHANARSVTDPCATVATGNHHGLALAPHPFTVSYNGELNEPHSAIDEPLSTATSVQRHGVGFPGPADGMDVPNIEDCYYRTLKAHEIKCAMGFPPDYILLGDARSQVKMAGNAVPPSSAAELAKRMMASIEGTGGTT